MSRDNTGLLVLACLVAACSTPDAPSAWPATLTVKSPTSQPALIGYDVNAPPRVQLLDAAGQPVSGAKVTFRVTSGGGSVTGGEVTTGSDGTATVGGWSVGSGANVLTASIPAPFRVPPVTFRATGQAAAYNIALTFVSGVSSARQAVFQNAAARWQQVVYGDLSDLFVSIPADTLLKYCGVPVGINELIDDLRILVVLDSIDGPGQILGFAGPCLIRGPNSVNKFLSLVGVMVFDTADVAGLENAGALQDVVQHEMGHVLGIGPLWEPGLLDLLVGPTYLGGVDPHVVGGQALAAFDRVGGAAYTAGAKVPAENCCTPGGGTNDVHWRESVFGTELMTGFIALGANPLSIVTIGSLGDEGYLVNDAAADLYTLPSAAAVRAPGAVWLALGNDVPRRPIYEVDERGRILGVHPMRDATRNHE